MKHKKQRWQFKVYRNMFGYYACTYTTRRGDYYKAWITNEELINRFNDIASCKTSDLNKLAEEIRARGCHYSKNEKL